MKNETLIAAKNVFKSYSNQGEKIDVLNGIDLEIGKGEIVAVVGPSGVGKSTLLHLLGTLDIPDSGEILYQGKNPFELSDLELAKFRNSKIGFVFQFHHLLPEFTAIENVMIPALIFNNDREAARAKAVEVLEKVGLGHRLNHRPAQLSGGERQRVAIARALINDPLVVLADEPTGNLDIDTGKKLIQLIQAINEKYNSTFVIATHNPEIAAIATKIVNLKGGKVL